MATISTGSVPSHTHRSWQILKAVPPLCCEASDHAADSEHLLHFPVVLNPGKHFLRSLIASLRWNIYLSTLLNCVLLDTCQMKTDGLIYPDVLPWLQESCKSRNPHERWTPKQARGRVKWFQATRYFWASWGSVDLEIDQGRVQASLQGVSPQLAIPDAISDTYKEQNQGTSAFPHLSSRNSCAVVVCSVQGSFSAISPSLCLKQKCAPLLMALLSQWRHKLFMDP